MSPPSRPNDDQPDLHTVIADAVTELVQNNSFRGDQPAEPVAPGQVQVRCQRTLRGVQTLNPKLNGGDLSACIALVTAHDQVFPWFFLTCRRAEEGHWQPVASVGGTPKPAGEPFVGKLRDPRSFVAIGALHAIPEGGGIRIELPDGSTYEDRVVDGGVIAIAPLTFPPDTGDLTTIRYLNPDGSERGSETVR